MIGRDADRATVIARYHDDYLPFQAGLLARLGKLSGKALGCWCAAAPCHADVLIQEMGRLAPRARRQEPRRRADVGDVAGAQRDPAQAGDVPRRLWEEDRRAALAEHPRGEYQGGGLVRLPDGHDYESAGSV